MVSIPVLVSWPIRRISAEDTATLQYKILQSHSVGVGDPIPVEVAKLMLITKVHALAQGYSGVQLATLERIIWHIENDVIPVVPEKGSVGATATWHRWLICFFH